MYKLHLSKIFDPFVIYPPTAPFPCFHAPSTYKLISESEFVVGDIEFVGYTTLWVPHVSAISCL